jgi:hypothetical protein
MVEPKEGTSKTKEDITIILGALNNLVKAFLPENQKQELDKLINEKQQDFQKISEQAGLINKYWTIFQENKKLFESFKKEIKKIQNVDDLINAIEAISVSPEFKDLKVFFLNQVIAFEERFKSIKERVSTQAKSWGDLYSDFKKVRKSQSATEALHQTADLLQKTEGEVQSTMAEAQDLWKEIKSLFSSFKKMISSLYQSLKTSLSFDNLFSSSFLASRTAFILSYLRFSNKA